MLAYDTADGRWKLVDRAGWDLDCDEDAHDSFEALASHMLRRALQT